MADYKKIEEQLRALNEDVIYEITILANASALLYEELGDVSWCGFYLALGTKLLLGPFQGKVACTEIPFEKGVCGTAAYRDETIVVEDVHKFEGHIACDSASNSEIVIPIHRGEFLYGVLDIDSTSFGRFSDEDKEGLERIVKVIEENL